MVVESGSELGSWLIHESTVTNLIGGVIDGQRTVINEFFIPLLPWAAFTKHNGIMGVRKRVREGDS